MKCRSARRRNEGRPLGITLLFAAGSRTGLEAVKQSYVIRASSYRTAVARAREIGQREAAGVPGESGNWLAFLGLDDCFRVVGALSQEGAVLGRYASWGSKTLRQAQLSTLRFSPEETRPLRAFDRWFLGLAVYFVGSPTLPRGDRHTVFANLNIQRHPGERVLSTANALASSAGVRRRVARADLPGEVVENLTFVGFQHITPRPHDPRGAGPFESVTKPYKSLGAIRSLLRASESKCTGFFRHRLRVR